ncbi:MAG: M23 family metallopeptidase [Chitinophagales bacterium]
MRTRTKSRRKGVLLIIIGLILIVVKLGCSSPHEPSEYPSAPHSKDYWKGVVDVSGLSPTEIAKELDRESAAIDKYLGDKQDQDRVLDSQLVWPAPDYPGITSEYGVREHPVLKIPKMHSGLDIAAPALADVVSSAGGEVLLVKSFPVYGQIILIDHGSGLATLYAHLDKVSVTEGEIVEQGEPIGRAGSSGEVTGPHLHFEVRQDGSPVNPHDFISSKIE